MKKFVSLVLISLYLLANTGLVVGSHICGSETTKVFYFNKSKKSCACGKVKMPKGCCKDTKVVASDNFDQQVGSHFDFQFGHSVPLVPSIFVYNFENSACEIAIVGAIHSNYEARPPSVPIYLLIHSFII